MKLVTPYETPGGWESSRAKWLFESQQRPVGRDDEVVTAFRNGEVTARSRRRTEGFTNAVEEIGYQGVRKGDLVIHSMDGFAGAIGVSDSDGKMSPVVHCYRPRPSVDARYYAYLLRDLAVRGYVTSLARGIRERSTAFDSQTFRSLVLPVPPEACQRAIADYLDTETAHIDALIEKKRRMVELTVERVRAVISELTDHGTVVPVRRVTSVRTSGPRGWAERVADVGPPFIRSANLRRDSIEVRTDNLVCVDPPENPEARRSAVRAGDVLVGITGANTGWVGALRQTLAGGYVSQHVAILRPHRVEPEWLAYCLFSRQSQDQLLGGQYGGTKQQLGLSDLAELLIKVPAEDEQRLRVQAMNAAVENDSGLRALLEDQILMLAERRQTLITAAVTGELDIPGVAA
jgi:type I restriction enzyme S subunit